MCAAPRVAAGKRPNQHAGQGSRVGDAAALNHRLCGAARGEPLGLQPHRPVTDDPSPPPWCPPELTWQQNTEGEHFFSIFCFLWMELRHINDIPSSTTMKCLPPHIFCMTQPMNKRLKQLFKKTQEDKDLNLKHGSMSRCRTLPGCEVTSPRTDDVWMNTIKRFTLNFQEFPKDMDMSEVRRILPNHQSTFSWSVGR